MKHVNVNVENRTRTKSVVIINTSYKKLYSIVICFKYPKREKYKALCKIIGNSSQFILTLSTP